MEDRFRNAPIGILEVDPDGTVSAANATATELLEPDRNVSGQPIDTVFPESVESQVPRAFDTPPETDRSIDAYYPSLDRWLSVSIVPENDGVFLYIEDETELYRTEGQLETIRADVDRLTVTNDLVSDVLEELVSASTRTEIAKTICTQLGETDHYEFAWVGEREIGSDDIVMRAVAGADSRTLDRIAAELDDESRVPERRAIESGEPETVQSVGQADTIPESIRRAAFADGVQSLLAVPLTYGDRVYGVVGVYSTDRNGFSKRERNNFTTVGEMAGFAINATRNRSLLLSDTVVELAFQITDPDAPFVATADELDTELSVSGLVPDGDRLLCYLGVKDETPQDVVRTLTEYETVIESRCITEHGDGGSLEVTLTDATPLGHLVNQGVTFQSAVYNRDSGRIQVELPPEDDVRRMADAFTRTYDATIVAKRERRQETMTTGQFRETFGDQLTDRQEDALRTAFFAEYFESPRGSTAEEVAEALGITGSTLLHHLRAGQRKLLETYFDTLSDSRNDK